MKRPSSWLLLISLLSCALVAHAAEPSRITNLYDAFGKPSALQQDWGFAALVEYGGKRILFDTGNNAAIFEHNVRQLGIDLRRLDAVVISHRHGDHTSGLKYLLQVNPKVRIYVPIEAAYFNESFAAALLARHPGLPASQQYYGGKEHEDRRTGSPWEHANFEPVSKTTEIFPGFYILTTKSQKPGTIEMNELSLAVQTPKGLAVVVGCSHPGVENILAAAAQIDPHLYTVMGGFHLVMTPEDEVRRVALVLHDELHLERVAPAHCTSELGFVVFMDEFKDHFDPAGLGAVIALP
ncbi:MAG TPA: MBL fold metallo-hydrolase [Steroidobacteraceae bacterium]|nr:MBL fold metallo-hydrolase [Steroidobacteraceae bacterium]